MLEADCIHKLISLDQNSASKKDDLLLLVEDFVGRVCDFCFSRLDEDCIEIVNMAICVLRGLESECSNTIDINKARIDILNELIEFWDNKAETMANEIDAMTCKLEVLQEELDRLENEN